MSDLRNSPFIHRQRDETLNPEYYLESERKRKGKIENKKWKKFDDNAAKTNVIIESNEECEKIITIEIKLINQRKAKMKISLTILTTS